MVGRRLSKRTIDTWSKDQLIWISKTNQTRGKEKRWGYVVDKGYGGESHASYRWLGHEAGVVTHMVVNILRCQRGRGPKLQERKHHNSAESGVENIHQVIELGGEGWGLEGGVLSAKNSSRALFYLIEVSSPSSVLERRLWMLRQIMTSQQSPHHRPGKYRKQ